jgi:hypothetical protein
MGPDVENVAVTVPPTCRTVGCAIRAVTDVRAGVGTGVGVGVDCGVAKGVGVGVGVFAVSTTSIEIGSVVPCRPCAFALV